MRFRSTLLATSLAAVLLAPLATARHGVVAQEMPPASAMPAPVVPPQFGFGVQSVAAASQIVAGSPAEKAGFRINDRVLLLDGKPVESSTAFVKSIAALPQKQMVVVTVLRQGAEMQIRATLDDYATPAPAPVDGKPAAPRGRLGLGVENLVIATNIAPGGLGEKAGLRRGDSILEINNTNIETLDNAVKKLAGAIYKGRAEMKLRRDGQMVTTTLDLGAPVPYAVTPEDNQKALPYFRSLPSFYKEIADDPVGGSDKFTGETELLAARVLDFAVDTPKPGQAIYVLSSPGDHMKNGRKAGAVYILWPEKAAVAPFKTGSVIFFRARLETIRVPEGDTPLELVFHGEEAFASPGAAFNPLRPLLRTTGNAPQGTLQIADIAQQTRENAAAVEAKLKGQPVWVEGVVHRLLRIGKDHSISFYPAGKPENKVQDTVSLFVRGDVGGALLGFKKGERVRFRGRLSKAKVETEEVNDLDNGGVKLEKRLNILFDADTIQMDEFPL